MKDRPYQLTPLTAAIATVLYPAHAVVAQEAENPVLEEVLVTATMRETSLQVVPQSIMAFTGEELMRSNIQSLDDLVNALPSLAIVNSQPGRNDLVYRGISSGSGEYYTDNQTAVYLDDSSISLISQQPFPHVVDVERVESLAGPQGTMFGSASQTGTLRYITRKPNDEAVSGEIFAEINSTKNGDMGYEVNGWVNVPITEGLALRAVAYRVDDGGWIDNVPGTTYRGPTDIGPKFNTTNEDVVEEDFNTHTLTGGRIQAMWELSDGLKATLAFISEDSEDNGSWSSDPYYGDYEIVRFFDEYRTDKWNNVAFTVEADLGFASFLSVTSSFDRDIKYEWDRMDYMQWQTAYWAYYDGSPTGYYVLYNPQYTFGTTFNDQTQKRFSQEFRFTSQYESQFQWIFGLYYEDMQNEWYYGADNPQLMETVQWPYAQYWAYYYNYYGYNVEYPLPPTTVIYSETRDNQNEQYSVFGDVTWDITDKWRLVGGARWFKYDRYDKLKYQFPEGLPPWGGMDTGGAYVGTGKTSDTLFKGSVQYQLSDNKMLYALYSEGIRLGGFNSTRAANTGAVPLEYDPDKLLNYELGLKSQWMDNRLLLNVTGFHMSWKEFQSNVTLTDIAWWLSGTINAADAETTGVELETTFLFTENLSADLSVFYADSEWANDYWGPWQDPDDPEQSPWIQAGQDLVTSPKWKGRFGLYWTIPGLFGSDDVYVNYDISFQDDTWNSLDSSGNYDEEGKIPSWNVSNLQVGSHFGDGWTVTLVVRNLFDQKAISWLDNGGNYVPDFFGVDWNRNIRSYNRPRNIGLQVMKTWN